MLEFPPAGDTYPTGQIRDLLTLRLRYNDQAEHPEMPILQIILCLDPLPPHLQRQAHPFHDRPSLLSHQPEQWFFLPSYEQPDHLHFPN